MSRNNYEVAANKFATSLDLKKQALVYKPNDAKITAELAAIISWNAESILKSGSLLSAMKLYRDEEGLLRGIPNPDTSTQNKLGLSLMRQALLSVALGDRAAAANALKGAAKIAQDLTIKDPSNQTWQSRLMQAQGRLLEIELTPENAKENLQRLEEICKRMAELRDRDPKNTFLSYQTVKFELGRSAFLLALGRAEEALANTDAAVARLAQLFAETKNDNILKAFLAEGLLIRADITRQIKNDQAARPFCQKSAEVLIDVNTATNEHSLLASAVKTNLCLGNVEVAKPYIAKLQRMGYRETRYLHFVTTHSMLKGKL
jgi:tetratricopeptide (TPR) repeat protein